MSYDNPIPCSIPGCPRTTSYQGDDEREFGVALCDPVLDPTVENHYLQFIEALDAGRATEWVAEHVGDAP